MVSHFPIYIPKKIVNNSIVLNPFRMAELDWYNPGMSGLEAFANAPTMAELLHAMELSWLFRNNISEQPYIAEWTSTFIKERNLNPGELLPKGYNPITVIHRPDNVECYNGEWKIEGGKPIDTFLPPEGWYVPENGLLWLPETGLPTRTIQIPRDQVSYGKIPQIVIEELAATMPYGLAEEIASMLLYKRGFGTAQAYRANGEHPIGAFRFRLFRLGDKRNDFKWFKCRPIQREGLEQRLV